MRTLAELSFDFIWHLMFTDEKRLEQDLAVRLLENLSDSLTRMSDEERRAFITVARERRASLLSRPDAQGPARALAEEQRQFLDDVVSGHFFRQFEEPASPDTLERVVPLRSY